MKRKSRRKPKIGRMSPAKRRRRTSLCLTIGAAAMSLLAALAALPYQLGDLATIIPPSWKPAVTGISLAAAFVLRVVNPARTA